MLPVNEMNQLFLAGNPDIRRKIRAAYLKAHPPVIVMAIKPKYARAIYEGRKNWEFRKAPPPIWKEIYIYESAPVSKITGRVMFDMSVTVCVAVKDQVEVAQVVCAYVYGATLTCLNFHRSALEDVEHAGGRLVTMTLGCGSEVA